MNFDSCVRRLESNGAVVAGLLVALPADQSSWKPTPNEWSVLEVINHFADEEVEDFRLRLRLVIEDPAQDWPPIDPLRWVSERQYNLRELSESIDRFVRARRESVSWLKQMPLLDWHQVHVHPRFGSMSAGDLLHAWCAHDLLHIRQITRLHYQYLVQHKGEYSVDYAGAW